MKIPTSWKTADCVMDFSDIAPFYEKVILLSGTDIQKSEAW